MPDGAIDERKQVNLDAIIMDLDGCGRYQQRLTVSIHLIKTVFCFSFTNLIIITTTPTWWCENDSFHGNGTSSVEDFMKQTCTKTNDTTCETFLFEDTKTTLVSEFKLICENDFIPSTINSLQLAGTLVANIISGQLADCVGRKPPFLLAVLLVFIFNLVGFFSTSWEIFAVSTFLTGFGHGCFITTQYSILSEYTSSKWRPLVIGFPSLALQQCLLSLLAWLIQDWRYLLLMTSLIAIPCLLASCLIVPESFRWYIVHGKQDKAMSIIKSIAEYNRHYALNIDLEMQRSESITRQTYSFLNLFKSWDMAKITLLSMLNWMALGVVGFGMSFGIQTLSGNIYFNLFLFSITSVPSRTIAIWLSNRIGRRKTSILCFALVAVAGLTVGILQTLDAKYKDQLTNILAIIANTSIGAAWGTVQTMTVELYPTVIRNIGFGTLSLFGGIGAVVGPQLVYLNTYVSGLLFYTCGAISLLCVISTLLLPETKDTCLVDKLTEIKKPGTVMTVSDDRRSDETPGQCTEFSDPTSHI